jgi:hypothetical protein
VTRPSKGHCSAKAAPICLDPSTHPSNAKAMSVPYPMASAEARRELEDRQHDGEDRANVLDGVVGEEEASKGVQYQDRYHHLSTHDNAQFSNLPKCLPMAGSLYSFTQMACITFLTSRRHLLTVSGSVLR